MRTTLTLDEDLAESLRRRARVTGRSFKDVVNTAIRRGLAVGAAPDPELEPFRVEPRACGFRAGIDIGKLNQLVDELEIERFGDLVVRDTANRPAEDAGGE